jgi:hypothetical protein
LGVWGTKAEADVANKIKRTDVTRIVDRKFKDKKRNMRNRKGLKKVKEPFSVPCQAKRQRQRGKT